MVFDLRTDIRDPKSGIVKERNDYVRIVKDGVIVYERGGKTYYEDGTEVPVYVQTAAAPQKAEAKK